ncbi:hypothetical protein, partial [Limnobacter sp.]|uniref:hypothetical protein n=1 Tax=Limnobacter sp. TaxID=2003368 RepID=UPI00311E09C0
MSSVLVIKKDANSVVYLSRNGIKIKELIYPTQTNSNPMFPAIPQVNVLLDSENFGSIAQTTQNNLLFSTYVNNNPIDSKDRYSVDFSNYQSIDQISKLEKYYLGMLQEQEQRSREDNNLTSIDNLSADPKFMLTADYRSKTPTGKPRYTLYKCERNSQWLEQIPGAFLSQEEARIVRVSTTGKDYSVLADWDENQIDNCDIVYKEPGIRNRIGIKQSFVPVQIAGTISSPTDQLLESRDFMKIFAVQPKINGYAVSNLFFEPRRYKKLPDDTEQNVFGINTFLESIGLDGPDNFALYYRMTNFSETSEYSIKLYHENKLIYNNNALPPTGTIRFKYLKRPKYFRIEIFEKGNKILSRQEIVSYRFKGISRSGISLPVDKSPVEKSGNLTTELIVEVDETRMWSPQIQSLDEINITDQATNEQIKEGKLVYQVVITKIYDGKFFDEEVILINRNQNGSTIQGSDGFEYIIENSESGIRKLLYETNIPSGGTVVVLANVRVYPLSMYLYEKKDIFLEFIDIIERGNAAIPRRKKLYFLDHPSKGIGISPRYDNDKRKNIKFLHETGTSKTGIVVYEHYKESYSAIPSSPENRIRSLINISVNKKILYWEKNNKGSIEPQVLPYQVIDIQVDDEIKPQVSSIELYSVDKYIDKFRHIGNFIPTATIRAVDFSTAAILLGQQINNKELPFSPSN